MHLRLFVFTLLLVAGCATAPPSPDRLRAAPKEQISALPVVTSASPAKVRVVRDVGARGGAVFMHLALDGRQLASLNPGEFVEFAADPGEHLMSTKPTDPFGLLQATTQEVVWHAGTQYRYRISLDALGAVSMSRTLD